MEGPNKFSIKELATGIFVMCLIIFAFVWPTLYFFDKPKKDEPKNTIPTKVVEVENVQDPFGEGGPIDLISFDLATTTIDSNQTFDLAVIGNFESAILHLEGNVSNDLLPYKASQFVFDRDCLPSLYDYLDSL